MGCVKRNHPFYHKKTLRVSLTFHGWSCQGPLQIQSSNVGRNPPVSLCQAFLSQLSRSPQDQFSVDNRCKRTNSLLPNVEEYNWGTVVFFQYRQLHFIRKRYSTSFPILTQWLTADRHIIHSNIGQTVQTKLNNWWLTTGLGNPGLHAAGHEGVDFS